MKAVLRTIIALALACFPIAALAGSATITTKDAGGTTRTFFVVTDGSTNYYAAGVICDQAAAAACASVGAAGSPSTNALTVQAVTLGHGTAANAMRVELPTDGTGLVNAAQSGTWNITNVSGTVSLPTGASTAAKQPALGIAGTASADVISVQGIASMTPLLVTLNGTNTVTTVSTVTNLAQMNGVNLLMGNGVTGTGSQRVTIASDNTAFAVNAAQSGTWNVTNVSGTVSLPTGASTSANQTTWQSATGAAPPANAVQIGVNGSGATGGFLRGLIGCDAKITYDASTNGSTELVALTSGRTVYVCGYTIIASGTVNVKLIYGTGTACATGSNNMTPAYQLTAQVGAVDGSPFWRGLNTASANALCLNTSAGVAVQAIVYYSII